MMIGTAHLEIHASLVGMEGRMLYRKIELYLKHFRVRNKQIQIYSYEEETEWWRCPSYGGAFYHAAPSAAVLRADGAEGNIWCGDPRSRDMLPTHPRQWLKQNNFVSRICKNLISQVMNRWSWKYQLVEPKLKKKLITNEAKAKARVPHLTSNEFERRTDKIMGVVSASSSGKRITDRVNEDLRV